MKLTNTTDGMNSDRWPLGKGGWNVRRKGLMVESGETLMDMTCAAVSSTPAGPRPPLTKSTSRNGSFFTFICMSWIARLNIFPTKRPDMTEIISGRTYCIEPVASSNMTVAAMVKRVKPDRVAAAPTNEYVPLSAKISSAPLIDLSMNPINLPIAAPAIIEGMKTPPGTADPIMTEKMS